VRRTSVIRGGSVYFDTYRDGGGLRAGYRGGVVPDDGCIRCVRCAL
jgi:hypothetical protein